MGQGQGPPASSQGKPGLVTHASFGRGDGAACISSAAASFAHPTHAPGVILAANQTPDPGASPSTWHARERGAYGRPRGVVGGRGSPRGGQTFGKRSAECGRSTRDRPCAAELALSTKKRPVGSSEVTARMRRPYRHSRGELSHPSSKSASIARGPHMGNGWTGAGPPLNR